MKVPCDDEREFRARLLEHVAENGLCIPTERGLAVSTRVSVELLFRNGGTLRTEGTVAQLLVNDGRSAVRVRLPALERPPPRRDDASRDEPLGDAPRGPATALSADEPLWARRPGPAGAEAAAPGLAAPGAIGGVFETSGEVVAALDRSAGRAQRGALVLLVLALAVAGAGIAWLRLQGHEAAAQRDVAAEAQAAPPAAAPARPAVRAKQDAAAKRRREDARRRAPVAPASATARR
jgi:hypothetical protein